MDVSIKVSKESNDIKYISNFIQQKCECTHCFQLRKKYNKMNLIYQNYNTKTKSQISSKYGSILDHNSTIYLNNNVLSLADSLNKTDYVQQLLLSPHHDYYMNRYYHINNIRNDSL
jgi:hypothetical protein